MGRSPHLRYFVLTYFLCVENSSKSYKYVNPVVTIASDHVLKRHVIPTRLTLASQREVFKTALMPNGPSYILICYFYEGQGLSSRTLLIWMLLISAVSCSTCVSATEVRAPLSHAHLESQLPHTRLFFQNILTLPTQMLLVFLTLPHSFHDGFLVSPLLYNGLYKVERKS